MRRPTFKEVIAIIIFFLVTLSSSLALRPLHSALSAVLESQSKKIFSSFEKKFGLSVSYESMSPSVVTGLRFKNIVLKDAEDLSDVVKIQKTVIRYSILDFLRGKDIYAIKDVTVDGFTILLNSYDDRKIISKIQSFIFSNSEEKSNQEEKSEDKKPLSISELEELLSVLPFNVFVKNVHLRFEEGKNYADLFLKRVYLDFLKQSSRITVKSLGNIKLRYKDKTYRSSFSADGFIHEKLDGSSIIFRLSETLLDNLSVRHLNLLANYGDHLIGLKSYQNNYPFDFFLSLDLDTNEAHALVETKRLMPGSVVSVTKSNTKFEKIKNISLSSKSQAVLNLSSKDFEYSSSGQLFIPPAIYKDGCTLDFDFRGNQNEVNFEKLLASGENIDVSFNGNVEFNSFRLSGLLAAPFIKLSEDRVISTEIFFDPQDKGFKAYAPQFLFNEKALTGLELDLYPSDNTLYYTFELQDYFNNSAPNPGLVKLDGSFDTLEKRLELDLVSQELYIGSIAQLINFFAPDLPELSVPLLDNLVLNGNVFFSSNLSRATSSFYVPYIIVADTSGANRMAYLELSGSEESIVLSRFDYTHNGKLISSTADLIFSDNGEFSFDVKSRTDTYPYSFTGTYMPGVLSIAGDYGFTFEAHKTEKASFNGSFSTGGFPFTLGDTKLMFSSDAAFKYSKENGIDFKIGRFEASEVGLKYSFEPRISLSGSASKYGLFFDKFVYSDKYSVLEGAFSLLCNFSDKIFTSASLSMDLKNPLKSEGLKLSLDLSNPYQTSFSIDNIKSNFMFNGQISADNFGLNRFNFEQSENNSISALLSVYGNLENPSLGLEISSLSLMKAGTILQSSCSAFVDEKKLSVDRFALKYGLYSVNNLKANFDLTDFSGYASCDIDGSVIKKSVHIPLTLSVSETIRQKGKLLPSDFIAKVECPNLSGSLFKKNFPFSLTVMHSETATSFYSGIEQGISGYIDTGNEIHLSIADDKPLKFSADGSLAGETLDVKVSDVFVDVAKILAFIDVPKLKVQEGYLKGAVSISGLKTDPDFSGKLTLSKADFTLPKIVTQRITLPSCDFIFDHNTISLKETKGKIKKDRALFVSLNAVFQNWNFDYLDLKLRSPKDNYVPGNFEIRLAKFIGDAHLDLNLHLEDHYLDVTGKLNLKNMAVNVKTKELGNPPPHRKIMIRADLDLSFGQHVTFNLDPLLRAVLIPGTGFGFKYDMSDSSVSLEGDLALRSGDVSYLSRNFYLKNGNIKFNKNETSFNPMISLQAETRERDEDGNEVRIILSAVNQYFDNFTPTFSSIPARSESQIMTMLGQIAVGDSENVTGLLLATGDYAIQSTIGRSIENKLRDFLNFDILSVRTNVLQNALNYNLNKTKNENSSYGIGNFLDNSTVYIGKYFGRSLYVDSLMHLSYDDTNVEDRYAPGGIQFQPEIGLEIESPFVNIRWNMAPKLSEFRTDNLVDSTSITLSWKFSF